MWGFRSKQAIQAAEGSQEATGDLGFGWAPFKPRWNNTPAMPFEVASRVPYANDYRPPESLVGSLVINAYELEGTCAGRVYQVQQGIGILDIVGYGALGNAGMLINNPLSNTDSADAPAGMPLVPSPVLGEWAVVK